MNVMQHKLDDLKNKVHGKTGIPPSKQHLYYGRKLLHVEKVLKTLNDQANLHLIFKLHGEANECEIYFDKGIIYCSDCKQYMCNEYSMQVHKHPKRRSHSPQEVSETCAALSDFEQFEDKIDEIFRSPSFNLDTYEDKSRVATLAERFGLTTFKKF